jgi:hypothetical protein
MQYICMKEQIPSHLHFIYCRFWKHTSKFRSWQQLSNALLKSNNITSHATNITSHATNLLFQPRHIVIFRVNVQLTVLKFTGTNINDTIVIITVTPARLVERFGLTVVRLLLYDQYEVNHVIVGITCALAWESLRLLYRRWLGGAWGWWVIMVIILVGSQISKHRLTYYLGITIATTSGEVDHLWICLPHHRLKMSSAASRGLGGKRGTGR